MQDVVLQQRMEKAQRQVAEWADHATHSAIGVWKNALTDIRQDYAAVRPNRFTDYPQGMLTTGSGADYHIGLNESDYYLMGELARQLERDNMVIQQGVRRYANNVIQDGFKLQPETDDEAVNDQLKERWARLTDDDNKQLVDFKGERSFHDFELLGFTRVVVDGDILHEPLSTGQLRPYESHRIRSPHYVARQRILRRYQEVMLGVQRSARARTVAYWVTRDEFEQYRLRTTTRRQVRPIPAWVMDPMTGREERNVYHCYLPTRFSQTRGVTALAPIMPASTMHDDIQIAKLVQQQMASFIGITHKVPQAMGDQYTPPPAFKSETDRYGRTRSYGTNLETGSEYWPHYAGEEINAFSPNIPNAEFFDQARMMLMFMALNLDCPLILFLMDASETNFSGWRGAMDQAKIGFKQRQRAFAGQFHTPYYHFQLRRWIRQDAELRRAAASDPSFWRHTWSYPRWAYVEPLKDVQADALEISNTLTSPRRAASRKGDDYKVIVRESVEDRLLMAQSAMAATQAFNGEHAEYLAEHPEEEMRWREIAYGSMYEKSQMQLIDPINDPKDTAEINAEAAEKKAVSQKSNPERKTA